MLIEGERGIPGRQQIEHDYHNQAQLPFIDITGIDGAWVKRDKVQCQLEPVRSSTGIYPTSPAALSSGCVLGVLRKALDDLAEKMPTPLRHPTPLMLSINLNPLGNASGRRC